MLEPKPQIYAFDNFRLDVRNRELLRDGAPVTLPSKAFDMLVVLIENGGRLIEKDELFSRVWPDQIVEESNLTVQVSALRKALGERKENPLYIVTVPGHGYRFIGKLISLDEEAERTVIERHSISRLTVETENEPPQAQGLIDINVNEKPATGIARIQDSQDWRRSRFLSGRYLFLAGFAVIVISLGLIWGLRRFRSSDSTAATVPIKSIAVLPFRPLGTQSRDEALELGMADALITKLSNIRAIVVRPTGSILKYQGVEQDPMAIGREQKVDLLVEGKIQRSGDDVRVTVQLVRVSDGLPLWADKFDEKFTNIFSMQDSISRQVAEALTVKLSGEQQQQLAKRYTDNIEAYNLYLKGRFFWNKFTPDGLEKAIDYYKQAIALDPHYALAYTGLSVAYNVQGAFGIVPPSQTWLEARRTAQKAVELDETLAESHSALGGVKLLYEWDWPAAEKELKRAIELNPNYAEAHELYGLYFWVVRDFEKAFSEVQKALELSPTSPILTLDLSTHYYYQGKRGEAIAAYQKVRDLDPNMLGLLFIPAQAYERNREHARAIEECRKALSAFGRDPGVLSALAYAYGSSGNPDKAQEIIRELETKWKERYFSPFILALAYTGVGNKDGAFFWLTKAYESRDPQLIWLTIEPQLENLRSDSRFQALVQQMGIPQPPPAR